MGKKARTKNSTSTTAPESDGFEETGKKIDAIELSATAFVSQLRTLPRWQQRAIVDEAHVLFEHGLRYLRIVVAGIQCQRTSSGGRSIETKNAANRDFARKFVDVWMKQSPANGQTKRAT